MLRLKETKSSSGTIRSAIPLQYDMHGLTILKAPTFTIAKDYPHHPLLQKNEKTFTRSIPPRNTPAIADFPCYVKRCGAGNFRLIRQQQEFRAGFQERSVPILVNDTDYPGVLRAVKDLQQDINAVTGQQPIVLQNKTNDKKQALIIGTIGKSAIIDELIRNKK